MRWLDATVGMVVGAAIAWASFAAVASAQPVQLLSAPREDVCGSEGCPPGPEIDRGSLEAEVLAGLAGMAAVSPLLAVPLVLDGDPFLGEHGAYGVAGALLLPFAVTTGIQLAGDATGGNGGWGWTLLGQAAGLLTSLAVLVPVNLSSRERGIAVSTVAGVAFTLGGGVLGYRLSSEPPSSP